MKVKKIAVSVLVMSCYAVAGNEVWTRGNDPATVTTDVVVDARQTIYAAQGSAGVYASKDGGSTWSLALPAPGLGSVSNVFMDSGGNALAMASFSSSGGAVYSVSSGALIGKLTEVGTAAAVDANGNLFVGTGSGLYKSTDGGKTYNKLFANGISSLLAVNGMIYVGTVGQQIIKSSDAGTSWTSSSVGPVSGLSLKKILSIAVDDTGAVYAGTIGGIYKSADFKNWSSINDGLPTITSGATAAITSVKIDAGGALYISCFKGVFKSIDAGATWSALPTSGLASTDLAALVLDGRGSLVVGSFTTGAYTYSPQGAYVTAGSNTAGTIKNLKLDLVIKPSAVDINKTMNLYAAVILQNGTIAVKSKAGWSLFDPAAIPPADTVALSTTTGLNVLDGSLDLSSPIFKGAIFLIGYGSNLESMIAQRTFAVAYTIP